MLPARFPIGLERLVSQFKAADFRAFYSRHYYPANMCLYLTGDINAEDMEDKIRRVFARHPPARALRPKAYAVSPTT